MPIHSVWLRTDRALIYLALGRQGDALAEFEDLVENRPFWGFGMILVRENIWHDPILEEEEFVEVRSRMVFPGVSGSYTSATRAGGGGCI